MLELHFPWMECSVLIPLAGAAWVGLISDRDRARRHCIVICLLTFLCAAGEWIDFLRLETFEAHDHWDMFQLVFHKDIFVVDDFEDADLRLEIRGLEGHRALSTHDFAARKRAMTTLRRVTMVAPATLEATLTGRLVECGASGYTAIPCHGAGRSTRSGANGDGGESQIRREAIVAREVAYAILDFLRADIMPHHRVTACTDTVEVLRQDNF